MKNSDWLTNYDATNETFWQNEGKKIAWKTLRSSPSNSKINWVLAG